MEPKHARLLGIATTFLSAPFLLANDAFEIHLKNPSYHNGVVETTDGGVICGPCLRIQACHITYTNCLNEDCEEVQCISAEGDLMMKYNDNFYVGDRLEFDLITKIGFLIDGRVGVSGWFMGGNRIELCADKSFLIKNAYLTTDPSRYRHWEISSDLVQVKDGRFLKAQDIKLKAMGFPLFYFPRYSTDLKKRKDPAFRYRLLYDKGLGPRISLRYRLYANETFSTTARFDYRLKKGPGGALEALYESPDKRTYFVTRNYGALDKIFPDEVGDTRYRFQGIFKTQSQSEKTRFHMQWDKLSDTRMISDFRSPDFEIDTKKASYAQFTHLEENNFLNVVYRPRINTFQSMNQELPYGVMSIRPFEIWRTGIIMENYASAAYLDYTFTNQLQKLLMNRKSGRISTVNALYRPFSWGGFNLTPRAGLVGIFYTDNPEKKSIGQLVYTYGGDANFRFSKSFCEGLHTVIPYIKHEGYSQPQAPVDDHFVFDIQDGYSRLEQLRFGVRQLYFTSANTIFLPLVSLDLYGYAFWGAKSFDQRIPKLFADMQCNFPSYSIHGGVGWNIQEQVLDYGNVKLLWTLTEKFALGAEFRHRSRFWWRKIRYDNYFVDAARSLDELLLSPLSDQRNTLLAKAHFRLSPRWNMQLIAFHGWARANEPRYYGAKLDFYTMLTGSWQMKLTYEYMPNDPRRFSFSFKLLK